MKAAPMRHYNSPEERAKREAAPAGATKQVGGFRHYNSPEERAKREAAGNASTAVVVPPSHRPVLEAPKDWPPAGQENTASVVVTTAETVVPASPVVKASSPLDLNAEERVELRRVLNNYAALEEAHTRLTLRVRAIERVVPDIDARIETLEAAADAKAVPATPDEANAEAPSVEATNAEVQPA